MDPSHQEDRPTLPIPQIPRSALVVFLAVVVLIFIGRMTPFAPVQDAFHIFGWVTETAVRIANDLFEDYGYLVTFLGPMLENTLFIGAIIPGTLVMLLAGLSAHDGLVRFELAVPLAILGAMIGDTISYFIGRFGWGRLGPESRLAKWSEEMRGPLMNHSVWLVLTYHFAGYSRLVGPAAAGFLRLPLLRWMMLDYAGVILWVLVFMSGGYLLGVAGLSLDEDSDRSVQIFEIILFAFFAIAVISILRAARRQRRVRKLEEPRVLTRDGQREEPIAEVLTEEERVG